MRTVGFEGGASIEVLGTIADVELFFGCVGEYAESAHPEQDWSLLTDRLYRRYLRLEELDRALGLMEQVREIFAQCPTLPSVDWDGWKKAVAEDPESSKLDISRPTLADVFSRYFKSFAHCVESAKVSYETFKPRPDAYMPVRVTIADIPDCVTLYFNRPLSEFDELEGKPLWLR